MAKASKPVEPAKVEDQWECREDMDKLLRADEVRADPSRYKRAVSRLSGTVKRLTKKPARGGGRSTSR